MKWRPSIAVMAVCTVTANVLVLGYQAGQLSTATAFVVVTLTSLCLQARYELIQHYRQIADAAERDNALTAAELREVEEIERGMRQDLVRRTQLSLKLADLESYLQERRQAREASGEH